MRRSDGRILTTHTGSLPRPKNLTHLFSKRTAGDAADNAEIARVGLEAVDWVLKKQIETGIDVINNGEQQRESFFLYLRERLTGLGGSWQRPSRADVERYPEFKAMFQESHRIAVERRSAVSGVTMPKAIGEVRYQNREAIQSECADLRAALKQAGNGYSEVFMSSPSPGIIVTTIANEHYDSEAAYLDALSTALKVEYEAIVANGFVLQIDAPDLALERHMTFANRPVSDFLNFVERIVAGINKALLNIPRDRVRLHVCWGNSESPHDCDVPLEEILPLLLRVNVGAFVLPFANPRHAHEIRYFRDFPLADDQLLAVGVIDPLTNFVEHEELIAERIERAAAVVGDPTRILAGTDCGFESAAGGGRVAEDVAWAKLASLTKGAAIASERLFGRSAR